MSNDSAKLEAERQLLSEAVAQGGVAKYKTYIGLSGPGWMQSALTLGGGSLASSLFLGVIAGVSMLWLQPLAMILGIIMLSAISYVTLSTGERPFRAINNHVNPVLGWAWLAASLAANMVWALPQYSLLYGVLEQNLMPGVLGEGGALAGDLGKWAVSLVVLVISTIIVWSYGSGGWGIKLYELLLKLVVAGIVLCFFGVVVAMSFSEKGIEWSTVFAGFIPHLNQLYEPAAKFQELLAKIPDGTVRAYWTSQIISQQRDVMISAAATAVGINMTFLLPYSLLSRGWTKEFRGLAIFDLSTGMLIPFVLATSCVVIASASQFHAAVPDGFVPVSDGQFPKVIEGAMDAREKTITSVDTPISAEEQTVAAAMSKRNAMTLSKSLAPLTGSVVANLVFGIGVVGMTLSTISLLMLISGFVVCEVLDVPASGWVHRIGCMAAMTGILWPILWTGDSKFWLAIVTSVFGMTLLPIAYVTFYLLLNQRSLLGDNMPTGIRRLTWNLLMGLSATTATLASVYVIWSKSSKAGLEWYAFGLIGGLLALTLVVQFTRKKPSQRPINS